MNEMGDGRENKEDVFVDVQQGYLVEEQEAEANRPIKDSFEVTVEPFVDSSQTRKNSGSGYSASGSSNSGIRKKLGASTIGNEEAIIKEIASLIETDDREENESCYEGHCKEAIIKDIASLMETDDREENESRYEGVVVEFKGLGIIGKK
ncbi:hypothetical protein V6N11_051550 [Hibiscus sabdariffa]|uniref:Uncharacterized protein n=1 Tax=Hibiscus sabdariffa TaxID=183260 RepID=A0ABR2U7D1_9ROSI